MAGGFDPLAGRLVQGQFPAPPVDIDQWKDPDAPGKHLPPRPGAKGYQYPGGEPPTEEQASKPYETNEFKQGDYDKQVAATWAAHQDRAGVPQAYRTQFPPDYTPLAKAGAAPTTEDKGVLAPTPEPPPIAGANPPSPPAARETLRNEQAGPPPQARPAMGGGGGVDYGARLNDDYNERIRAMEAERNARSEGAANVAGAFGNAADEARDQGLASEAQAHASGEAIRAKIAEVQQLNEDYAKGQLDPNPLWGNESVPHEIGAVLGTMLAGIGGGVKGAQEYFDNLVEKNLMVQRDQMERQYKSTLGQQNLLGSLIRTSDSEQDAMDKARAVLYGAAMTEVQKAAATAKGPVETAQINQLIADMKATRDAMLAKLQGQARAAAANPANGMLEVSGEDIIQHGGQSYLITDKSWGDTLRNTLSAYDRLGEAINAGEQSLRDARPSML